MKKSIYLLYFSFILSQPLHADDAATYHRYLWVNYNHFSGNITATHDWYKKIFSTECSLYTYKGYLHFLSDTKQFKHVVELIPTLDKKFEKDPEVQLIFVTALEKTNQSAEADNRIIKLNDTFKTHADITFRATQTYLRRKEPHNALIIIDAFLNNTPRKPNNFVFYFFKSQISAQLGKNSEALENIDKCLEMHPQFDKGWFLRATLQEQKGQIKDAIAGYATFLELSGGHAEIEKHLARLMLHYKQSEENKNSLPFNKSCLENAFSLLKQNKYPQALDAINKHLEQKTDTLQEGQLLKIEILTAMKQFDTIAELLSTWFDAQPQSTLWPKTAYLLSQKDVPLETILVILQTLQKNQPQSPWPPLYAADLCIRHQSTTQAIQYLEQAIPLTNDTLLKTKIFYQLGLLYYEKQEFAPMITALEKAYALETDFPPLNNSLAYYWATQGKDVTKAQKFIDQALAHEKTNPYFLDTQAHILYKQKKYTQAQQILEPLIMHNNATILLHLAKVHYYLDNKQGAQDCTSKAETLIKNNHEKNAFKKMKTLLAINEK